MISIDEAAVVSEKDKALLIETKRRIQTFLPRSTVLLYGSVARGTQRSDSDYDILVLTEEPLTRDGRKEIEDAVFDLELDSDAILSTTYRSWDQWNAPISCASPFHKEVERDAIKL